MEYISTSLHGDALTVYDAMNHDLVPRLFRDEFSKITSVLSKHFSLGHIEIAEDIASETFLLAMETWPYKGVPENPTAWLYSVAKNKAKNFLARTKTFDEKVKGLVLSSSVTTQLMEVDLSTENIRDSQLRMLFALCHPSIPAEAQIGLCLRILCGFSIDEIATAFLSNKETINKRLLRAKERLRVEKITLELPAGHELLDRMQNVLTTLYLLFSEGYYSETHQQIVREPLCEEAIRLTRMLLENPITNLPEVHALLALMYFHASRLQSRTDANGSLILYSDQDSSRWNQKYISLGAYHLNEAAQGTRLSKHHLEAGIAYWYTIKEDTVDKWEAILQLYNKLLQVEYSPIAALNRTYALSKCRSVSEAISEAEKLKLETNPYYFSLLGELYNKNHEKEKALRYFRNAAKFSRSPAEKELTEKKIREISALHNDAAEFSG